MHPTAMNTPVYAMLRGESLALPQMPWPEVHPLPIAAPHPTRTPDSAARPTLTTRQGRPRIHVYIRLTRDWLTLM